MQTVNTWRELLAMMIKHPDERQRLTRELRISNITLNRWISGESKPRLYNLQNLLDAIPQSRRNDLLSLLPEEFPGFIPAPDSPIHDNALVKEIPSSFYAHFFQEYASTNLVRRYWILCNLVLQQALRQLDPYEQGVAIVVSQCMKPVEQKVRSIRIRAGMGTPPWPHQLELHAVFLAGAESLAGYVISSGRSIVIQSRANQGQWPVHWVDKEESVAAYPLLCSDRVAGCLTCSSTQPGYFTQERQDLLKQYAELIVLACDPDDFYDLEDIDLRLMPDYHEQLDRHSNFRQRVMNEIARANQNLRVMSIPEAEYLVWRDVEEELLHTN